MTNVVVTLISSYPRLKMLSNVGKLEFIDGVCKVNFNSQDEANKFIKLVKENRALGSYVRVANEVAAKQVIAANINESQKTSISAGVQTSEVKENGDSKPHVTAATIFKLAEAKQADNQPELPLEKEK